MEKNLLKIIALMAVALLVFVANADAKCGDCLPNGIACINATSFHICTGANADKPDTTQLSTCPEEKVCTGLKIICAPANDIAAACDDSLGCGTCGPSGFTCISKTRFALCSAGEITAVQGKCPVGSICDSGSSSGEVCVDQCGGTPSCNIED